MELKLEPAIESDSRIVLSSCCSRVSSGFEADWDLSDPSYTRYKFWCDGKNG